MQSLILSLNGQSQSFYTKLALLAEEPVAPRHLEITSWEPFALNPTSNNLLWEWAAWSHEQQGYFSAVYQTPSLYQNII